MKFQAGDRVRLNAKVFPKQAHLVYVVEPWPTTPRSEMERLEVERGARLNAQAGEQGPWIVFVHLEHKPEKWRVAWTSHLVKVVEVIDAETFAKFSTGNLEMLADLALGMGEPDLHAQLVAEIERRQG